jgi:hypothetical protein
MKFLVGCAFAFAGLMATAPITSAQAKSTSQTQGNAQTGITGNQSIEGTTYSNRTAHFTLTIPLGWHITDSVIKSTPNVIGTVAAPKGGVGIVIGRYKVPFSPQWTQQILEHTFSEGIHGYHRISESPMKIDGGDASSFVFQFDNPQGVKSPIQGSSSGKALVVLIRNEDGVLEMMCEAPDPLFGQTLDLFKAIVFSYHHSPLP